MGGNDAFSRPSFDIGAGRPSFDIGGMRNLPRGTPQGRMASQPEGVQVLHLFNNIR